MATTVFMEALSPTMEEGRLVKWHKQDGDSVKAGETLAEVETDKAIMDLVARADGVLGQITVKDGETVAVGKAMAVIAGPGETVGRGKGEEGSVAPSTPPPAERTLSPVPPPAAVTPAPAPAPTPAPPPAPVSAPAPADATRVKASPLARRIARETGADLKVIVGSGPGGRVVKKDLEGRAAATPAVSAPPVASAVPFPLPSSPFPVSREGVLSYEDVPLTQIRKTIAKRLATSLGPVPHFFLTTEVDMERAAEARQALNETLGEDDTVSFNSLILKATAVALTKHRACNAWFADDHIRYWHEVHLGMAVAVEDGLITPVIRDAAAKSLAEIGREARALADLARARRLQPAQYTGATFSVSNLGMFDIDQFTAVINPPEAGILAVGSIAPKAVVHDGQLVMRRRLRVTMSCDHRVIDGATGAAFLKTLKGMLENPMAML
jgi:pyruvate dehydrogenase E2 component (dihydrolipoamide acetyltransferase)